MLDEMFTRVLIGAIHGVVWQVGAISKFEGKSGVGLPGSDSVKGQHLLPFLPAFTAFVARLEDLLAGLLHPKPLLHQQHGRD